MQVVANAVTAAGIVPLFRRGASATAKPAAAGTGFTSAPTAPLRVRLETLVAVAMRRHECPYPVMIAAASTTDCNCSTSIAAASPFPSSALTRYRPPGTPPDVPDDLDSPLITADGIASPPQVPPLSRLPDAIRRLYVALQRFCGPLLLETLQVINGTPTGLLMANYWPPAGLLLASCWPPAGLLLASRWPPAGLLLASCWPPAGLLLAF